MEHSLGINIRLSHGFIIYVERGSRHELWVCSDDDFAVHDIVELPVKESHTREPTRVLSMAVSDDTRFIAVFVGKELIKNEEHLQELIILEKIRDLDYEILTVVDIEKEGL